MPLCSGYRVPIIAKGITPAFKHGQDTFKAFAPYTVAEFQFAYRRFRKLLKGMNAEIVKRP
jgi:hypothetical protein